MKGRILSLSAATMLVAAPAHACTLCHSGTAISVRHQFWEHDFLLHALVLPLPILILGAALFWLAREPQGDRDAAK